tara:strand:+ start:1059 stop:1415 length:357 start_codon:yes stop_codon:yes gene_type:complete
MPIAKKEIELNDGSTILVKQVSGRKKIKIEAIQAKVYRRFRHNGDPNDWTSEQHEEFADALDELGAGLEAQVEAWLPECIESEGITIDDLDSEELMRVLSFARGDTEEGAIPLESSQE